MTILLKAIYRCPAIPIKLPTAFFTELEQKTLKFVWRQKRPLIAKAILREKIRSWRNQAPWLQTILQSHKNQDNMVLAQKQKYRSLEQDRTPRDKPTHIWSTNLWQRRQGYTMEKDSLFNKWCWENWTATCKRMKLEHSLTTYRKINSKWIKDLNIRHDNINILE